MGDRIVTKGIPVPSAPDGPVPIRREIRSLQRDFPDQWTLYVLGLKVFQEADENDLLSYYRIAGIHGRPYRPWNNVTGAGPQRSGYCTHASILFPTWHRPYLALFEEILYQIVQRKATEFPEAEGRARYVAAARDFRIPYWDWAAVLPAGTNPLPTSLSSRTLNLVTPTSRGRPTPVDNPLYSFKFHPVNPVAGDFVNNQVRTWTETVRWPLNGTSTSQNQRISQQIELLNSDRSSNLREKVFGILASYRRYGPFSNKQWTGVAGEYGSLEDVHDTIHVITGGSGTRRTDSPGNMGMVPYAAFDPLFWLHHTNVDRLFAIWQALNPTSYVTPQLASEETVTTQVGTQETRTTGLTPFWANPNAFWTSDGARKTGNFGYAYPETQAWRFGTPQQYQADVRRVLRQLYGGSSLASIIAESTPGNLSNRAQLNIPVDVSVRLAPKEPVKPAPKEPVQPTESSPAPTPVAANLKASSATVPIDKVSAQNVEASDQKPLGEANPKHEEHRVEPKHEDAPKADPKHEAPKTEPKHQDNPKADPKHEAPKTEPKHQDNPKAQPKHEDKGKTVPKHEHHGHESEPKHRTNPKHRDITDLAPKGKYREWLTNFKVQKHCLSGPFAVHVFLGDFDRENPLSWISTPNKVGSFNVLGDYVDSACEKCISDRERQLQVTGQVPLTLALAERFLAGQLANLAPENVIPYLQTDLHWRVTVGDGTEITRAHVPSLTVSVVSNEVTIPTAHDQLPQYSDQVTIHPEATTAINGGGRGEGTGLTDVGQQ